MSFRQGLVGPTRAQHWKHGAHPGKRLRFKRPKPGNQFVYLHVKLPHLFSDFNLLLRQRMAIHGNRFGASEYHSERQTGAKHNRRDGHGRQISARDAAARHTSSELVPRPRRESRAAAASQCTVKYYRDEAGTYVNFQPGKPSSGGSFGMNARSEYIVTIS